MKKRENSNSEQIRPDLKHDTMEYSAATDGDDKLDPDQLDDLVTDDITAEELSLLEADSEDEEAAALSSVEADSASDTDNFFTSPDEMDELDDLVKDADQVENDEEWS